MKKILFVLALLLSVSANAATLDCYGWRFGYTGKHDERTYFLIIENKSEAMVQRANEVETLPLDRKVLVDSTKVSEQSTGFGNEINLMSEDKTLKISMDIFTESDRNGNVEFKLDGKTYNIHVQCDSLRNSKKLTRDYQKRQAHE